MKRLYIITGANGHLAGTLVKQLRHEDCDVRGLILPNETCEDNGRITYYKGDITDIKSMIPIFSNLEGYEVIVIHAASIISIADEVTPRIYQVNVEGTKNMIKMCQDHKVKRMLHVSSVHAIPEKGKLEVIEEVEGFSKDLVVGAYAKTKAEATQAVMDAIHDGLDAVVVHPSGIIGPFDAGHNYIVQMIEDYVTNKLPAGVKGGYDFVDVRDVARGVIDAINHGVKGECYILSNRYYTIQELLGLMQLATNGKKKICVPIWMAKMMLPLFEWIAKITKKRPLFTRYSLYTVTSNGRFSHDKATMTFRYHPRDMLSTIEDTVEYLKGNKEVTEF